MRINIGPYRNELIPSYALERKYENWRSPETFYLPEDKQNKFDKFVFSLFYKLHKLVQPINRWYQNRERKVKVHIDNYDVWSADHTLAMIIAPTLKKLKAQKHGYPQVDNEDVPEKLRYTIPDKEKHKWDSIVQAKYAARWEWVLDEMIWTFDQYADGDDYEQFSENVDQLEMVFTSEKDVNGSILSFNYQKDTTKPAYMVDKKGKKKHYERKQNGLRLFAKYYESLWD